MIKLVFMINRVPEMTFEQFVNHHRTKHAPLFMSIPEAEALVQKYVVSHPVPAEGYPSAAYDGLTEIWFENWPDHAEFFSSKNYQELVHPDEATFIDISSIGVMVTEELVIK